MGPCFARAGLVETEEEEQSSVPAALLCAGKWARRRGVPLFCPETRQRQTWSLRWPCVFVGRP
eukprot:4780721-Lingulodinium_polyedra.AAC.1